MTHRLYSLAAILLMASCTPRYDIIVAGGGTSACSAALQASRAKASVLMLGEYEWVGGMLTSAGVSAIDGNFHLRAGIFGEFCDSLAAYYGGYGALKTGWVSNIQFEPHVGEEILHRALDREKSLKKELGCTITAVHRTSDGYTVKWTGAKGEKKARCTILIDCTELGDVAAMAGATYRIGMDDKHETMESAAAEVPNDIIQDLTYVAILKDYGQQADMTIPRPKDYDRSLYADCCLNPLNSKGNGKNQRLWSAQQMIDYGRLPAKKYMLNWPIEGNDYYLNVIEATKEEREKAYRDAKNRTLGFIYFIQTELGMKNLGIADDEFPTEDGLALMPYNRESRRIVGEEYFTLPMATDPYSYDRPVYRQGIAVGDYAVDHHHFRHPQWEELPRHIFAPIWAFSIPMGCLIPKDVENLIVAEKSISVSNIMNGTTRLQPVVMELGQAAGEMAVQAIHKVCRVRDLDVRSIQNALLESGCYIQPYRDLPVSDPAFKAVQRIGASGILHCTGEYVDWQNKCFMRCDDILKWNELHLSELYDLPYNSSDSEVTRGELLELIQRLGGDISGRERPGNEDEAITRKEAAVLIDNCLHPFDCKLR